MREPVRRGLLAFAIATAIGLFLLALALEALSLANEIWYVFVAFAYSILVVIAIFCLFVYQQPAAAERREPAIVYRPALPSGRIVRLEPVTSERLVEERILYTTARGYVRRRIERDERGRAVEVGVETGDVSRLADDVEREVDRRGWTEGRSPRPDELRRGLERWGRLQRPREEVSR